MNHFTFNASLPKNPDKKEIMTVSENEVVEKFNSYDWNSFLILANEGVDKDIYYEFPVAIINPEDRHILAFFPSGEPGNFGYFIHYSRPKTISKFLGLKKKTC